MIGSDFGGKLFLANLDVTGSLDHNWMHNQYHKEDHKLVRKKEKSTKPKLR